MVLVVRHARTSGKPAGLDPSKIQGADWDADHVVTGTGIVPVGTVIDYCGIDVPAGWLECYGQQLSAAAYPALFAALVKTGVVTITQPASPCVISWPSHGRRVGDYVGFQSTGTLPGGITTADLQIYRIISAGFAAGSFRISLTWEGVAINTIASPAQAGVHTGVHAPFGVSTGLTTFAVPDYRGMVLGGITNMGGTQGTKLASGYSMSSEAGAETVVLTAPNLPAHSHTIPNFVAAAAGGVNVIGNTGATNNTGLAGSGTAHLNMQPTEFTKKIIFAGV